MLKKVYKVVIFNYGNQIIDNKIYLKYEDALERACFINTVYKQPTEIKKIITFFNKSVDF